MITIRKILVTIDVTIFDYLLFEWYSIFIHGSLQSFNFSFLLHSLFIYHPKMITFHAGENKQKNVYDLFHYSFQLKYTNTSFQTPCVRPLVFLMAKFISCWININIVWIVNELYAIFCHSFYTIFHDIFILIDLKHLY